jgi:hypothetical protein
MWHTGACLPGKRNARLCVPLVSPSLHNDCNLLAFNGLVQHFYLFAGEVIQSPAGSAGLQGPMKTLFQREDLSILPWDKPRDVTMTMCTVCVQHPWGDHTQERAIMPYPQHRTHLQQMLRSNLQTATYSSDQQAISDR